MSQVSQVSLSISGRKSAHNNIKIYFYIIMAQKHSPPNQKTLMTCVTPMTPMTHTHNVIRDAKMSIISSTFILFT